MNYSEYSFKSSDFSITPLEVGRWIGYSKNEIPPSINDQIVEVLGEHSGLIDVRGGYVVSDYINIESASLQIENIEFKTKKIISRPLKKATSVAIFTCTVGDEVSKYAAQIFKEDALKGYIADVAASVLAEKAADKIANEIKKFAQSQGKSISNRYSPGYCGWSVADQHLLFSFLPDNFCGISLNEAAMMFPVKSISGIIGIGKEIVITPYQCHNCDLVDCFKTPVT